MKRWIVIALVLGACAVVVWRLQATPPVEVTSVKVAHGKVEATVANTRAGTIKACRRAGVSLNTGGQVIALNVKEGDHVKAGTVMLQLRDDTQQALVAQAEAHLQQARHRKSEVCFKADSDERETARMEKMYGQKLAAEEAIDTARTRSAMSRLVCQAAATQIEEAAAGLALQRALLAETRLLAPFDGVVAEINGELGEYVTPSPPGVPTPPAIDLIDDSCLYVQAPIDEVDAAAVKLGQPVRVTLDAWRNREFAGTVTRIAPFVRELEKQARTVDVDVKLSETPVDVTLLVGYSADIEVVLETRDNVLRIPTETVMEGHEVLRIHPTTRVLEKVAFEPGLSNWVHTEVRSGLAEGDEIVRSLDRKEAVEGAVVTVTP